MNRELAYVGEWLKSNRLSLNVDRTEDMIISHNQIPSNTCICLNIINFHLKKIPEAEILVIIIDDLKLQSTCRCCDLGHVKIYCNYM